MYQIMLVEDEMLVRESMAQNTNWDKFGFAPPHVFENGRQALEQLESVLPDVVITDICMPFVDGLELARNIYEKFPDTIVVVLTGFSEFSYAQKAIRYACMDYLVKPVQKEALLELIRKAKSSLAVTEQNAENERWMQEMQLKQYIIALLRGKQNEEELKYVKERLRLGDGGLRYIHISMQNISDIEELSDSELQVIRSRMYDYAMEILEDDGSHLFRELHLL